MKRAGLWLAVFFLAWPLAAQPGLVPRPLHLTSKEGFYELTGLTRIFFDPAVSELQGYADRFAAKLRRATGLPLPLQSLSSDTSAGDAIYLMALRLQPEWGPERYSLEVTPQGCRIRSSDVGGFFYGMQTLLQLLPPQIESLAPVSGVAWQMPCVAIQDQPRFRWRGMHLDVARHFSPVTFVKKYIDMLAMYKMNTFHWHLTDDQGWRIEIKKYPELTRIGAWRRETTGNGVPHSGFYTQEEVREVVAYAAERAITVVPEIEMPGHASAALASYPWLGCTGGPYQVATGWGIFNDVFCPGKETTFAFLEDVLTEVIALFPGQYIHVGGDECPKFAWRSHQACQDRIKAEGLKNEDELQSWLIHRIERFINANGRTLIGWDEILEGGLAPNAAVMSWRGFEGGVAAARSGHDVVMSPTTHCYFDYYQALNGEPRAIGGFLPLEKVYSLEPVPDVLLPGEAEHILGAQANLWTEYIPESRKAEYMLFPRLCALSEVDWTAKELRDYDDFSRRMASHYERLQAADINVRFPPEAFFAGTGDSTEIGFQEADPASGLRLGQGARIGSDGLLWAQGSDNQHSGLYFLLPEGQDLRFRIPWYSLTLSYKTNMTVDSLFIGFIDGAGKKLYLPLLSREQTADNKWYTITQPLSGFTMEAKFDSANVARFGLWTNNSRSGARFYFSDIYLGVPTTFPAAHAPVVFFDGENFNPAFRIKGFANAAGSGVAQGAGLRPETNALRWLPPADKSASSIRWRFDPRLDFSDIFVSDTLKLALRVTAGSDSLQLAFNSRDQKLNSCWLTASEGLFDGAWHNVAVPLDRFIPDPEFVAKEVELFSIFVRNSLASCEILLSDIWIGQPPAYAISLVSARPVIVEDYRLEQNYPNPFNPLTTIVYRLPQPGRVRLTVHNVLGQRVASLVDSKQEGGTYQLYWDAQGYATGLYYYRLEVNDFVQTRRMVLVR